MHCGYSVCVFIVCYYELLPVSVINDLLQTLHIALLLISSAFAQFYELVSLHVQAINKLTQYLSFQVKNIARELVDAFDLPDHVTRAPIAMQSQAYSQYTQYVGF